MFKQQESQNWDKTVPDHLQGLKNQICSILNRPIDKDALNIVGTALNRKEVVQIYGWKSPIQSHVDNTGLMFFMPIYIAEGSEILVYNDQEIQMQVGTMYLIDDSIKHHTVGGDNVVALFKGSFTQDEITDELFNQVMQDFEAYLSPK